MPYNIILNFTCIGVMGHICNRITRKIPHGELKINLMI